MNSRVCHRLFRQTRKMVMAIFALSATVTLAGSATWTSSDGTLWSDGANWHTQEAAGADSADTAGNDTATIRGAYQPIIVVDKDVYLAYLLFSQYNGAMSSYMLSSTNGGALHICKSGGTISYTSTTVPDAVVTIGCPVILHNNIAVECNNGEPSSYLHIAGTVTSDGVTGREFGLKGYAVVTNVLSGPVVNNGDALVSIVKSNVGVWRVTSTNSTYTGYTQVTEGTLIACADVYLDRPNPFGMPTRNDYAEIRSGYINPAATLTDASFLLGLKPDGTGAICYRAVSTYNNNYESRGIYQPAHIGGANTSGTTTFAGSVALRRASSILQCATGGRVAFTGTFNSRNQPMTIGCEGFEGIVDFQRSFSDTSPITVSNGTMEANCTITANVNVDGGTLAGIGTIAGDVVVAAGGTLSGGTNGVDTLTITGDATLSTDASLAFRAKKTASPFLAVTGTLSLDGAVIRVDRDVNPPAKPCVVARATGGIVGTPDLAGVPGPCTVRVTDTEISISFLQPTVILVK